MKVTTGLVQKDEVFHVVDIRASFNVLLGRPWIHGLGAVPSTLHQKVKLIVDGQSVSINAAPFALVVHNVENDTEDNGLCGFEVAMADLEPEVHTKDTLFTNEVVEQMLQNQGHFPGMSLGIRKVRAPSPVRSTGQNNTTGLGYRSSDYPSNRDEKAPKAKKGSGKEVTIVPYPLTLNGQFIKQDDEFPCYLS